MRHITDTDNSIFLPSRKRHSLGQLRSLIVVNSRHIADADSARSRVVVRGGRVMTHASGMCAFTMGGVLASVRSRY